MNSNNNTLSCKAFAKVNLFFKIVDQNNTPNKAEPQTNKHFVQTVLFALNLHDEVTIDFIEKDFIEKHHNNNQTNCKITMEGLEGVDKIDETDNLAYKAAQFFTDFIDKAITLHIHIKKNIPLAAGLAGGSADAAAVLYLLNQKFKAYEERELYNAANTLGTDIAFSLYTIIQRENDSQKSVAAIGSHYGEVLESLEVNNTFCQNFQNSITLETFSEGISTKESYRKYDEMQKLNNSKSSQNEKIKDMNLLVEGLKSGDKNLILNNIFNDLEEIAYIFKPDLKTKLTYLNAPKNNQFAFITGSGPTIITINRTGNHV